MLVCCVLCVVMTLLLPHVCDWQFQGHRTILLIEMVFPRETILRLQRSVEQVASLKVCKKAMYTIIITIRRNTCKEPVLTDIAVSGLSIPHMFRILIL
jgi:spore coat protein CotH